MTELAIAVAQALAEGGVTTAFGVLGNGNARAVAALTASGVRYIAARHEGGAITMADAYHRVTGNVAVCTTTYGPGITNTATGLAEAVKHRSGVLMLCGDRPANASRPIDIDQEVFAEALGAQTVRLVDPAKAYAATADALWLARSGPRPVVLSMPSDLLTAGPCDRAACGMPVPVARPVPADAEVEAALEILADARRPLLLAGLGAWRSMAASPIAALGDRLGALFATTVMAAGMFHESPWSLGICGGFSSPRAARIIGAADAIIAFGTSLSDFTLHGGRLLDPQASVVQVELAGTATAHRVDLCVTGDASKVACALLDRVSARGLAPSAWRSEVADEMRHIDWAHERYDDASTASRIDPRTLSLALAPLLPAARTLVTDGGHFVGWPAMYWPVSDPSALVFTGAAFQSIGLGFAGAVGAAAGRADRTTVVALGDGGALMGLPELETLIRTAHSALVVIYDDAAYGAEVHLYRPLGIDITPAMFNDTDFAGLARALGAEAVTVRTAADLDVVRAWRDHDGRGTLVLDCKIVPDVAATYLSDLRDHIRAGGA